ncbi:DUF6443 domain-containing protein [Mucilaginibacter sp. RS28]|uniref:DUF6443 domain-containing protein n=1 Tax=Mucilaginibacter straminoryzae TaxID=2932774 RepID=A0A9X1X6I2_9SPHI|nr:DUF6443 domain-containing protein [Mucilaginibacter straminoryzae]MCJ8212052.1 DUF6443 domain-containing protein [Mucilaginibacter straminoryzae]
MAYLYHFFYTISKRTALTIGLFFISLSLADAQTLVTAPMTSPPAPGEYYNYAGITLSPGFSFTAQPGQSLHLYIAPAPDCQPLAMQFTNSKNYVATFIPRDSTVSNAAAGSLSSCQVMPAVQYFDGLGRLLQTVQVRGATSGADMVQPVVYDQYGREAVKYLPYAIGTSTPGAYRPGPIGDQSTFYNTAGMGYLSFNTPFAPVGFEPSPLNRVVEQGAPGADWQLGQHTVKTAYGTNGNNEVILWQCTLNGNGATGTGFYNSGELTSTTITDENGHQTIEYKDKEGHVVCKKVQLDASTYLATYYVYDAFDNLAYVIPPIPPVSQQGMDYPTSFNEQNDVFIKYIYGYHYDGKKRLIEKKIPGKGWEYLIYNDLDQVVMTQDGVQRARSPQEWNFTKYDALGRVIITGIYYDDQHGGQANTPYRTAFQSVIDYYDNQGWRWESRDNSSATGYTNICMPGGTWPLLSINYYDDYNFPGGNTYGSTASGISGQTAGLLTGTKIRKLDDGATLLSINYYDQRGRVRESIAQNHIGGADRVITDYDFTGAITQTTRIHNSSSVANLQIINQYDYDHMGRKVASRQQTGAGNPMITLSKLEYNEVGQLWNKRLHSTAGAYLQNIAYDYNERGWLRNSKAEQFAIQLNYNSGSNAQWNGNISSQVWGTSANPTQHNYAYSYDALNRITSGTSDEAFNESNIGYDYLGNILSLTRNPGGTNTYAYNGNRLTAISGFVNSSYVYDGNGNQTDDSGKGIHIDYNVLNLPKTVTKASTGEVMNNVWLSTGAKVRKSVGGLVRDYVGGIEYNNGSIEFIQTEEGRAVPTGNGGFSYDYMLKDQLGNTRVLLKQDGTVLERNDYYPFGQQVYRPTNTTPSPENRYKYNDKELQTEVGLMQYDYGARFYDPVIGRFATIDVKAEEARRYSPYGYAIDNPIRFIDINGEGPGDRVKAAREMTGSPYKQETGVLRTGGFDDALRCKDCSEFINRVLAADEITNEVLSQNTAEMQTFFADSRKFIHSNTAHVGDIALWKGHVGLVSEVDKSGRIRLIHARGIGKLALENKYFATPEQYRDSEFYGYYRPVNETPDGKDLNKKKSDNSKNSERDKKNYKTNSENFVPNSEWLDMVLQLIHIRVEADESKIMKIDKQPSSSNP